MVNEKTKSPEAQAAAAIDHLLMLNTVLGDGPKRFAVNSCVEEAPSSLSVQERMMECQDCVDALQIKWEERHPYSPFTDDMYLCFARCSPGPTPYNDKTAWKVMKKFDRKYEQITANCAKHQLLSKTLFPVPQLKTKQGLDVVYMRPSRYSPKKTSVDTILHLSGYVFHTMTEQRERACTEGIAMVVNMKDWTMQNYSTEYWTSFMAMLNGSVVPVRVSLLLFVDAPSWFESVWHMMQPMLGSTLRENTHRIRQEELGEHFEPGYVDMLPDDMSAGRVPTDQLVQDFVSYRMFVEKLQGLEETTDSDSDSEDNVARRKAAFRKLDANVAAAAAQASSRSLIGKGERKRRGTSAMAA